MLENFKQTHFIQQIMNTNLKTISYNITFLSDLLPEDNVTKGEVIEYKPNDLIFDAINDKQLIESINDDSLSELTKKTMEDSKKGKNLHQYNSTKEMFDELT
jgi:hypothetical protein